MQKKIERFIIGKITSLGEWDWTKKEKCMVCGLPIKEEQEHEKVYCPHCLNAAHKNHLLEWIKLKGTCPLCLKKLSRSDFDSS
ncbi:MAG: zinc finger domain-containing protein [Candidatus Helarchaeota archaeon]